MSLFSGRDKKNSKKSKKNQPETENLPEAESVPLSDSESLKDLPAPGDSSEKNSSEDTTTEATPLKSYYDANPEAAPVPLPPPSDSESADDNTPPMPPDSYVGFEEAIVSHSEDTESSNPFQDDSEITPTAFSEMLEKAETDVVDTAAENFNNPDTAEGELAVTETIIEETKEESDNNSDAETEHVVGKEDIMKNFEEPSEDVDPEEHMVEDTDVKDFEEPTEDTDTEHMVEEKDMEKFEEPTESEESFVKDADADADDINRWKEVTDLGDTDTGAPSDSPELDDISQANRFAEVQKETSAGFKNIIEQATNDGEENSRIRLRVLQEAAEDRLSELSIELERIQTLKSLNKAKYKEYLENIKDLQDLQAQITEERESLSRLESSLERIKKENIAKEERLTAEIVAAEEDHNDAETLKISIQQKSDDSDVKARKLQDDIKELNSDRKELDEKIEKNKRVTQELLERETKLQAAEALVDENLSVSKEEREATQELHKNSKELSKTLVEIKDKLSDHLKDAEDDRKHVIQLRTDAERIQIESESKLSEANRLQEVNESKEKALDKREKTVVENLEVKQKELDNNLEQLNKDRDEFNEKFREWADEADKLRTENVQLETERDKALNSSEIVATENETYKLAVDQLKLELQNQAPAQATQPVSFESEAASSVRTLSEKFAAVDQDTIDPIEKARIQAALGVLLEMAGGKSPVEAVSSQADSALSRVGAEEPTSQFLTEQEKAPVETEEERSPFDAPADLPMPANLDVPEQTIPSDPFGATDLPTPPDPFGTDDAPADSFSNPEDKDEGAPEDYSGGIG